MMLRKNTVFAGGFCVFRSQIGKTILRQCARCLLEHNLASILERERKKKPPTSLYLNKHFVQCHKSCCDGGYLRIIPTLEADCNSINTRPLLTTRYLQIDEISFIYY